MLITCPHCTTSYQVEPSALGPAGRSVRCVRCQTVWFGVNSAALTDIAAAHRVDVAQFATADSAPEGPAAPEGGAAASDSEDHRAAPGVAARAAAEIEVIEDAPPLAATDPVGDDLPEPVPSGSEQRAIALEGAAGNTDADAGGGHIEAVAARRIRRVARTRRNATRPPGLPTIILMLAVLDLGLIGWRTDIVRLAPQMAPLYAAVGLAVNVRGLVFTDVTIETQQEGTPALLVQGSIVSTASHAMEVPRLRFAARNASGTEIYRWTALPERAILAPGETLPFQSRLASPPSDTSDVLVRFFNRLDLRNGIE